jgi:UDP-N-acetylglucosamine--N-acetylmuramyl-(pentapeptide) pyrophosphoryl-undecaprenol N-acetylglucosamine transferase
LAIHEQNAIPGMTNQLLSRLANKVMEAFAGSFKASTKAIWVGNPVRKTIEELAEPAQRFADRSGPLRLLILGGSLGARALNTVVPQAIKLAEHELEVKHQCGKRHIDDCQQSYRDAQVEAEVVSFINDMAEVYGWADLVICRSGALTVAELCAAGVPSILVPFPYAVDDHQTKNGQVLTENGAAKLIQEQQLSAELLAKEIDYLAANRGELVTMANAAREQANINTAAQISDICLELANA